MYPVQPFGLKNSGSMGQALSFFDHCILAHIAIVLRHCMEVYIASTHAWNCVLPLHMHACVGQYYNRFPCGI